MTGPAAPTDGTDSAAMTQALRDNAQRLGLTWDVAIATVKSVSTPGAPTIVFDADTTGTQVPAISMVGNPGIGSRVYVFVIPGGAAMPGGNNYIVGFANPPGTRVWSSKQVLSSAAASFVFTIPQGVCRLELDWTLRDTTAVGSGAAVRMLINGDTANNYVYRSWQVAGATGSAGVHNQTFAINAALVGVYATAGTTAGRYGNGWVRFPAWNNPHASNLGWTYMSDMENAPNDGWLAEGGGFYGATAVYSTVTLLPQAGSTWDAGSQVIATGLIL